MDKRIPEPPFWMFAPISNLVSPLPVKAAGGVRSYADAVEMIQLGVQRIGTSGAKAIIDDITTQNEY